MKFVVPAKLTPPTIAEGPGALVPVTAQLPVAAGGKTTLSAIRSHDDTFTRLLAHRGANPAPQTVVGRYFNSNFSWLSVWPAGAALAASPAFLASTFAGAVACFGAAAMTFAVMYFGDHDRTPGRSSPLSLVARNRPLKSNDLAFVGDMSRASPLERAIVGLLAERWKVRFDRQQVAGEAAYLKLEQLAAAGAAQPDAIREQAKKVVALHDVMRDPKTGRLWSYIDSVRVRSIVSAFEELPAEERRALAPELLRQYFKNEVPRFRADENTTTRALYRALCPAQEAA